MIHCNSLKAYQGLYGCWSQCRDCDAYSKTVLSLQHKRRSPKEGEAIVDVSSTQAWLGAQSQTLTVAAVVVAQAGAESVAGPVVDLGLGVTAEAEGEDEGPCQILAVTMA